MTYRPPDLPSQHYELKHATRDNGGAHFAQPAPRGERGFGSTPAARPPAAEPRPAGEVPYGKAAALLAGWQGEKAAKDAAASAKKQPRGGKAKAVAEDGAPRGGPDAPKAKRPRASKPLGEAAAGKPNEARRAGGDECCATGNDGSQVRRKKMVIHDDDEDDFA